MSSGTGVGDVPVDEHVGASLITQMPSESRPRLYDRLCCIPIIFQKQVASAEWVRLADTDALCCAGHSAILVVPKGIVAGFARETETRE
jgi:hypothetical protein